MPSYYRISITVIPHYILTLLRPSNLFSVHSYISRNSRPPTRSPSFRKTLKDFHCLSSVPPPFHKEITCVAIASITQCNPRDREN